jgi:hypothetical protein
VVVKYVLFAAAAAVVMSGIGCCAGEETREDVEEAASGGAALQMTQGIQTGGRAACRADMSIMATTMEMYYAANGRYPDRLEDLRDFGGTPLDCPGCHIPYRLSVEDGGTVYILTCPAVPTHGSIEDGVPSWL